MSQEPQRPAFLICTVGGSPQPIATALRELRPAVVWFLVSDGSNGESSRSQVESEEIDYDKQRGIRGPGLKVAEGCPATTKILQIPADDPDRAYGMCRSHLAEARRRYPDHRPIADYTGGTKSMTGALLMAALAQSGFEVQFMIGERPDLVQVRSGSERPHIMSADFIMAERDFPAAEQAVEAYDYAAAQLLLEELRQRLTQHGVKPPKAWSRRLEQALAFTGVMAQWDAFRHREAAQRAQAGESWLRGMLESSGHLRPLLALGEREKGKPSWEICGDLWLNALRRGERGRYDDAVARLYRLLEAVAQTHVLKRHGLETGRIPPTKIPESMRSRVAIKKDRKTGAEYAELGLNQAVELLRARNPDDVFVAAYTTGSGQQNHLQGPAWLSKRNRSILAHGFASVDQSDWDEARTWIETNLITFFHNPEFLQLPRKIPALQDTAV
jgi:CRISPR-associated protein (TIGR02710 family)